LDDASGGALTFGGFRIELKLSESSSISAYYARFGQDQARYLSATGNEHRDIFDVHFAGTARQFDWDVEAMLQFGHVGSQSILGWGTGAVAGYTFAGTGWKPRIGLQVDAASGDNSRGNRTLGTFNPLFPNGETDHCGRRLCAAQHPGSEHRRQTGFPYRHLWPGSPGLDGLALDVSRARGSPLPGGGRHPSRRWAR
jgi:hypothetical protein